jgi:arabinogalactan endo-1,4-beta-galactosidase
LITVCFLGLFSSCDDIIEPPQIPEQKILSYDVVKAWDISTYAAWKDQLPSFFDSAGTPINIFNFMHSAGVNTIRLRIIHGKPSFPHPTLEQLLWIARIAQQQKLAL